ncbi:McrC family protein [Mycobacterium sp. E2327]|uniref:McrC family protein n=1 Tax=Mycobacterium sp. E2327 TaxID=1834132 RepID=UPI0018D3DDE6|nr:hypothetical protein [Mycobacterium sp. E2327]
MPVAAPAPADLRLAEQLASNKLAPKIAIRWLRTGEIEVSASSWVGVIRLSNVEIHVVPKLVGGSLGVLRMLQHSAGVELIARLPTARTLASHSTDLLDIITLFLAEESKWLIRDGLLRDYRPVDDNLGVLRGRVRLRDQYLRRFGQLQPLECSFDEYDADIPENQLIAAALRVACRRVRDVEVRAAALRQAGTIGEICDPPTTDATWYERNLSYGRRNDRYRGAHELSKLILSGLAFEDLYDTSGAAVAAFMLDMNVLFERFVTRLVRDALRCTGLAVSAQRRVRAVIRDDESGRTYNEIRPDLLIEDPNANQRVPVDVKYKLYADRKLASGDVYQLFLYAYVHGTDVASRRAGLIYPATADARGPVLSIRTIDGETAARITAAGLDVQRALDLIAAGDEVALHNAVRAVAAALSGFTVAPRG